MRVCVCKDVADYGSLDTDPQRRRIHNYSYKYLWIISFKFLHLISLLLLHSDWICPMNHMCAYNICLCKKFHCGNFTFINFGKNSWSRILHIINKYVSFHVLALKRTRFATRSVFVRHAVYRTALRHTSLCLPHSMSFLLTCNTDKLITNP